MIRRLVLLAVLSLAHACGGGSPPEDEVTESWTAGDDEPLDDDTTAGDR